MRYEAFGWQVLEVDGHDRQAIREAIKEAQSCTDQPSLLCCRTIIAKGSPNKSGHLILMDHHWETKKSS